MAGCGAETEANSLITSLTQDVSFVIPNIDMTGPEYDFPGGTGSPLYQNVTPVTIEELTSGTVDGTGAFDVIMKSMKAHLQEEYKANRISGAEYTKAYIAMVQSAMDQGVQFVLQKDQAMWAAINAQIAAITGRIAMQTAKVQLASIQLEAQTARANYALTKMKLSTESITYCTAQYQLTSMLPVQLSKLTAEKVGQEAQNTTLQYTLANILPQQVENLKAQEKLYDEQTEAQRGQTSDNRTDGAIIKGVMGKQKDLYVQQITSYQRDSEVKAAKLFTDAWITQKTIDEGLLAPSGFQNASIDVILAQLKLKNGFQ